MIGKENALTYLRDVAPETCFWVNNGPVIKNLDELSVVLKDITDDAFCHHVNKEKNDFSKWVSDVVGDNLLAKQLSSSRNSDSAFKKVKKRVDTLKKKAAK